MPSRSDEAFIKFTVTNVGKEPIEFPVFPNLKPFAPSKKSVRYSVTVLKLYLTLDSGDGASKQEHLLDGGASLFGTKDKPDSLVLLATGKSLGILVRVVIPTQEESRGKRITGHASLQTEKILEIDNEMEVTEQNLEPQSLKVTFQALSAPPSGTISPSLQQSGKP